MIILIGKEILSSISSQVKDALCFANETSDKSIKSQSSIVVKYLKGDTLTERCIDMINQSNLKGKALTDTILSHLKSLNVLLEKMISQGCDEAGSISHKEKSDQAIVRALPSSSCMCSLFGTCIELSFVKILCNT